MITIMLFSAKITFQKIQSRWPRNLLQIEEFTADAFFNRDRCCRFKLLCALKIMKNSKQAKSFYSLWDIKICKQNLFTPINC